MLSMDYLDWPYEVSVETFAKCNAACTFCPYPTLERIGTKMPDAMIDGIIEELKAHPFQFYFAPFKVNEPFLDKRLIPICERVNRELPNAVLRLFTNGSALTDKHIAAVDRLERVEHLWISLNECNPKGCARWFELSITATGLVSLCCMDGEGKYAIGDLNRQGLLEVYNSPHWRERREKMQSRLDISPCNLCTY
jgi:hypothetical protein